VATFVDITVKEIDARLEELNREASSLMAAREALIGPPSRPSRPGPAKRASAVKRSTKPASSRSGDPTARRARTTRADQALDLIHSRPGITIPELAGAMKIQPNYLYRVIPSLEAARRVKRDGRGWRPTA
jgi:hypothetical protein